MNILKTQGFVLLDTDVAALNNSGKDTQSNYDNAVATKKITKGRSTHVYVWAAPKSARSRWHTAASVRPVSRMSSTTSTVLPRRSSLGMTFSCTVPDESVPAP